MKPEELMQPDDDSSSSSNNSGLWSSDSWEKESIEIGDKINYWLTIHVWGDKYTMRCSKVVKIVHAEEMYEPHLHLENGDTVLFGSVIQKVKETFSEDPGTQKRWRSSSLYEFKPSEDKKEYRKSITRDSDIFKNIAASARETAFLGENKKEYRHQTKNSDPG